MLRREIEALNYTRSFTIYDDADQLQVVKAAMKDLKVDERLVTTKNHTVPNQQCQKPRKNTAEPAR